jgi:Carboxypeptidase regulatory-like domain
MRRTLLITIGALALAAASLSAQSPAAAAATKLLPGTHQGVLSTIQGSAVTSSNGAIVNTAVRLRDVRSGRIVDSVTTDKQGMFVFKGVDPGNYVVEVMNPAASNTVMASSQVLNVGAGEAISALVKLPFRIPAFAGLIGNSSATTAQAVTTAAQAVTAAAAATNTVGESPSGVPATCSSGQKCQ